MNTVYNKEDEERTWFHMYTTFNDDDYNHAENAFIANGYNNMTAEELHAVNVQFAEEIRKRQTAKN